MLEIDKVVQSGKRFILEAFDHDIDADDSLGKTKKTPYVTLIEDEEEHDY